MLRSEILIETESTVNHKSSVELASNLNENDTGSQDEKVKSDNEKLKSNDENIKAADSTLQSGDLSLFDNFPAAFEKPEIIFYSCKRNLYFKKSVEHPVEEAAFLFQSKNEFYLLFIPTQQTSYIPVYPQGKSYGFKYCAVSGAIISFQQKENEELDFDLNPLLIKLARMLVKWCKNNAIGYKKRVIHDQIVEHDSFSSHYSRLKGKYSYWVHQWTEKSDPVKSVYEDISIASFLVALWEKQQPGNSGRKYHFVDLGCGNGFLSYILASEGYVGYGVDRQKRKIWDSFSDKVLLENRSVNPNVEMFDAEWIIGNHSDELTGHIPIISYKSASHFLIIPCCFFNIRGSKAISFANYEGNGRYMKYLNYIQ